MEYYNSMNKDLLESIIRGLLKAGTGALTTYGVISTGAVTDQMLIIASGVIAQALLEWWSKRSHLTMKDTAANVAIDATKAATIEVVNQAIAPFTAKEVEKQINETQVITKDIKQ